MIFVEDFDTNKKGYPRWTGSGVTDILLSWVDGDIYDRIKAEGAFIVCALCTECVPVGTIVGTRVVQD